MVCATPCGCSLPGCSQGSATAEALVSAKVPPQESTPVPPVLPLSATIVHRQSCTLSAKRWHCCGCRLDCWCAPHAALLCALSSVGEGQGITGVDTCACGAGCRRIPRYCSMLSSCTEDWISSCTNRYIRCYASITTAEDCLGSSARALLGSLQREPRTCGQVPPALRSCLYQRNDARDP